MRIKKLILENFRGFHQKEETNAADDKIPYENKRTKLIEVTFPDSNLCVFIGENGSGKSTILDAIAISLSKFLTHGSKDNDPLIDKEDSEIVDSNNGYSFSSDDVNVNESSSSIDLNLTMNGEDFSIISKGALIKDKTDFVVETNFTFVRQIKFLEHQLSIGQANLPVLAFYNIAKLIVDDSRFKNTALEEKKLRYNQFYAYANCFTKNLFDPVAFSIWFKDREDWENEITRREQGDKREKSLEVIRIGVRTFLKNLHFLDLDDIRIDRDNSTFGKNSFSLVLSKKNDKLKLSQLSAGEKAIILLAADISRRLAIANPGILQDDQNNAESVLYNATGIILIDEIDLHLHPKWQKLVIPALTATFPNIQFIVTTHSASVLKSLTAIKTPALKLTKDAGIEIVLPEFFIKSFDEIYDEMFELPKDQKNTIERLK